MRNYGYDEGGKSRSLTDLALWKQIWALTRSYRPHLFLGALLSAGVTGATLLLPALFQQGIDKYIINDSLALSERLAGVESYALLYGSVVITLFLLFFSQTILLEWVSQRLMHRIRNQLFSHLHSLGLDFFNRNSTGSLVTRLTNDIQNMHEMFTSVLVTVCNDLLRLLGILLILISMDYELGLLLSLFLPIALLSTALFSRLAREAFRQMRLGTARLNSFISEIIAGIALIQVFGGEKIAHGTFTKINQEYQRHSLSQVKIFGLFMPLTEFFASLATALILWYGGGQILARELTLGELVAFLSYMRLFFQPLRELSQKYSIVQAAMASAERIFALFAQVPERQSGRDDMVLQGEILFSNLSFSYSLEQPTLVDISLAVPAGTKLAIVGTTGSGKSSLLNLLLGFYQPAKGKILLDGVNIKDLSPLHLRSQIGIILQDIVLLDGTVEENIVMESGASRDEVEEILQLSGLDRFVGKLPQGLQTVLGQGGRELSTGEKQLLSFARVLCRKPQIIILDEATAAVDSVSEKLLEQAIAKVFSNHTMIIVAHRLSTIRHADTIVVLEKGRLVEQGDHCSLLQQSGRYAKLLAMDSDFLTSEKGE